MADKTKAGKKFPAVVWEVERGKMREFVRAIGDMNPIFTDKAAAEKEGYRDTPASTTFLTVPAMWCNILANILIDLNVNIAMILHGEEEYEYYQEIYPGDILTGIPQITRIEEKASKSGRLMDMVTIETLYMNQKGENVAKARSLIVERK